MSRTWVHTRMSAAFPEAFDYWEAEANGEPLPAPINWHGKGGVYRHEPVSGCCSMCRARQASARRERKRERYAGRAECRDLLQEYLEDRINEDPYPSARFVHDCNNCQPLGEYVWKENGRRYDLYVCRHRDEFGSDVVARFGHTGPDYLSAWESDEFSHPWPDDYPLQEARRRAALIP
jgi:hypothetical protein